MSSKKLNYILNQAPAATVDDEIKKAQTHLKKLQGHLKALSPVAHLAQALAELAQDFADQSATQKVLDLLNQLFGNLMQSRADADRVNVSQV